VGGETQEQSREDDRPYPAARPRSSSYGIDEALRPNQSDAPSQITSGPAPSTNSYPGPAALSLFNQEVYPSRSVAQLRARAVSPAVSNYFGLSRKQESTNSPSSCSKPPNDRDNNTSDELSFWGSTSLRYRYDLFSDNTGLAEDEVNVDGDSDNESSDDTDDDDDDGVDTIDIFGHL
jgi:hypothetical protein